MADEIKSRGSVLDAFIDGARQGWELSTKYMLPYVLMAFAIIRILNLTGLLPIIGRIFEPLMILVGLPGVAATVLMGAFMSMGGGVGVAVGLLSTGDLQPGPHIAILLPAIYIMGSLLQYIGRVNGVIGIPSKYNTHTSIIAIISAFICMFIMNLIVS